MLLNEKIQELQKLTKQKITMENPEKDKKYLYRLRRAVYRKGLDLRTFTIRPEHINAPAKN